MKGIKTSISCLIDNFLDCLFISNLRSTNSYLSPVSPLYYSVASGAGFGQSPYPYGCILSKAPSGRELPTKSGEGERVTMKLA